MEEVIEDFPRLERKQGTPSPHLSGTHVAPRTGAGGLAVCFDSKGRCHYGQNTAHGDYIVAVVGEQVSDKYLMELRAFGASYLFAGPDGHDIPHALNILRRDFDARTLVIQGGGVINVAFLKAGVIDEISLLIYPAIDGLSGVPAIFESAGAPDERPAE